MKAEDTAESEPWDTRILIQRVQRVGEDSKDTEKEQSEVGKEPGGCEVR